MKNLQYLFHFIIDNFSSIVHYIFFEDRKLRIRKNEIVCDFGGGSHPLLRADIIVDKYLSGVKERPLDFLDTNAYIIQCDLEAVPFRDKAIDFAYSSHTIEHISNLKQALDEMSRTSKKGYITCPSAFREQIVSYKMHVWYILNKNNRLVIEPKRAPYQKYIGDFMDKLLSSKKAYIWHRFEKKFKNILIIEYFWQNNIQYTIKENKNYSIEWKVPGETNHTYSDNIIFLIRKIILKSASKFKRAIHGKKNINILDIIFCPKCKGQLTIQDNKICKCSRCGQKYPHYNKRIFYLLEPLENKSIEPTQMSKKLIN
jgi:hypothetical protein